MKREFLRGLGVEEDAIQKIIDEHHDGLQSYKEKADKVDSLKEQLNTANEEIANRDKQIKDLQAKAGDNEELNNQLQEYKDTNANYEQKIKDVQLNKAIEVALAKENAIKPEQVIKLIDTDKLEVDDNGNVKGLDDYMGNFKEENSHLFEQPKPTGNSPVDGSNPTGNDGITQEQFNKMTYSQKVELKNSNPDKFYQLTE
ncbi:phage scaffolding protein [Staphylococcus epidermidis]|uniref:phage scaffolding protein n=1 Tax=Staphylococcus epidermidis TaxID=1282 RepID=UPI0011AB856F|nr:phage scaffolding protein [Staphylococcus epidermidis]WJD66306.1 phage scaffolding protein [Staphylococcus epidermidis]